MRKNRRLIPYIFAGAMLIAPFLALLYDVTFGLAVLTVGLAATAFLAIDASRDTSPIDRRRLLLLAAFNAALAVAAAGFVVLRFIGS